MSIHLPEQILIVDDFDEFGSLVSEFLKDIGMLTVNVTSTRAALEVLASERVSLVVTDLVMPEKSGLSLIIAMRRLGFQQPIIVCSGFFPGLEQQDREHLGVVSFLNKPIDISKFQDKVRQILGRTQT